MRIIKILSFVMIISGGCAGSPMRQGSNSTSNDDDTIINVDNCQRAKEISVLVGPGDVLDHGEYGNPAPEYFFYVSELSDSLFSSMDGVSYSKGAPVTRADLRVVSVLHHDFDGNVRVGRIICHKLIAQDILEIFRELYEIGYQIESVMPVDNFGGDDNESMKANNTSCFNYRPTPGGSRLSHHAYGTAIDINPLLNPYVRRTRRGTVVLPEEGRRYVDRSLGIKGMLTPDDPCVAIFKKHGFKWGGDWRRDTRDYQHFEKPLKNSK